MLSFVSLFLVLLLVSSCFGLVVFFHPPLPPDPPSPSNQLCFASAETLIGPFPLQSAITFAYGLGIRKTLTLRTREFFLHPSIPGLAGFGEFRIFKLGSENCLPELWRFCTIFKVCCRNSIGHILYLFDLFLWCAYSCKAEREKNIRKIKAKKRKSWFLLVPPPHDALRWALFLLWLLQLSKCALFLISVLFIISILDPSLLALPFWDTCRPATRTSTWDLYSALLSVIELCSTNIHIVPS